MTGTGPACLARDRPAIVIARNKDLLEDCPSGRFKKPLARKTPRSQQRESRYLMLLLSPDGFGAQAETAFACVMERFKAIRKDRA
jgi:hypothetical protein